MAHPGLHTLQSRVPLNLEIRTQSPMEQREPCEGPQAGNGQVFQTDGSRHQGFSHLFEDSYLGYMLPPLLLSLIFVLEKKAGESL